MIFITVGTHEQPFDRLLKTIDRMLEENLITEEVICQKGFTEYKTKNYKSEKLMPYEKIQENIKNARIIITHGGPASFIAPLSIGKIPIVVPRKKEFDEHVNDHQVEFSRQVSERMHNIIVAENEDELISSIINYEKIIDKMNINNESNNILFNKKIIDIVDNMFEER